MELKVKKKRPSMITYSNQVCFAKMTGRRIQEEVIGPKENSPPQPDLENFTYYSWIGR